MTLWISSSFILRQNRSIERTMRHFRLRIHGSADREVDVTAEDLADAEMLAKKICIGAEKVGSVEEVTKVSRLRDL